MQRATYCVVEGSQGWVIRFNGNEFGPSPSRASAVLAAFEAAAKAYAQGLQAQVLIHMGERMRTIWVNGENLLAAAAPATR